MTRLCIVGCGLTGAITASLLKRNMPHLKVIILEKSRGTGGRFCTSRSSFGTPVDIGAQFITKTLHLSETQNKCFSELLETGLLKQLHGRIEGLQNKLGENDYFVCPQGSGSIVKHFLKSSGCEILFNQRVIKLSLSGHKWKLFCNTNVNLEFDAVILTIPVPQVLKLDGIFSYVQDQELENMKSVEYCSRLALGLFYDYHTNYFNNIPWIAKYITDDVLRFCSFDHKKKGANDFPSVALHSTKEFGKIHIDDDSSAQNILLSRLQKILPDFPKPSLIKYHKWRYSQVENSYVGNPGCIMAVKSPLLVIGGDGFSNSNFEGCIFSSEKIVNSLNNL